MSAPVEPAIALFAVTPSLYVVKVDDEIVGQVFRGDFDTRWFVERDIAPGLGTQTLEVTEYFCHHRDLHWVLASFFDRGYDPFEATVQGEYESMLMFRLFGSD